MTNIISEFVAQYSVSNEANAAVRNNPYNFGMKIARDRAERIQFEIERRALMLGISGAELMRAVKASI